ncbi:MAG TPA: hypothetical protein VFL13_00260 [Candidatus Baltobacteraceae bacterium]|nr:hypothetical protein [Candidatus Baltobacteraceae bacterium]
MMHALLLAAATSTANLKSVRAMVYSLTYSTPTEQYKGTIHADVLGVTQDGGLVVRMSQTVDGDANGTFAQADCAVYPDTRVQCQKANALSAYENELAHLMGRKFINGDQLDDKNHWRIAGGAAGGTVTDDFTINSNTNGILDITESRDLVINKETTHHAASITYDLNHTLPTKLHFTDSSAANPKAALTADIALTSDSLGAKL